MELIKVHPPIVHFALAMPLSLLLIDLYYRIKKIQPDMLHLLFSFIATFSVLFATLSGMVAYEPIEDRLGILRALFTFMLLIGVALVLFQGYMGGSVVYDHMVRPWLEGK